MKNEKTVVDIDYAEAIVPKSARRGIVTMFMIMLGFTFFSASMWVGQQLADGLDFQGFVVSMIVGGVILSLYTGLLGYVGAETGMSLDLLARKAFGVKGSYLPSAMISFTQIGWFGVGIAMFAIPVANELLGGSKTAEWALVIIAGVCMTASAYFGIKSLTIVSYIAVPMVAVLGTVAMILAVMRGDGTIVDQFAKSSGTLTVIGGAGLVVGSFVSGGTATPNFSRFAKSGKVGAITTVIAFFIGNSLMFFFGGVSSVYVGGNDIFEVMINLGLFYLAILVLGLNIWTTNDNALYSAGLGLANIFGQKKKPMVLVSGIIGTVLAVWLYWNFCGWLNILNCTLPPVGIILVLGYFLNNNGVEIISTGGTMKVLKEAGVPVTYVSDVTGTPEMMDGRVKTLNPKIHGGILAVRSNPKHMEDMKKNGIQPIDLVVVNLYPFQQTIAKPDVTEAEAIENIDIGGPAMVRASAKNFHDVVIITNPDRYEDLIHMLKEKGDIDLHTRKMLAQEAFAHTAEYDTAIAAYLKKQLDSEK